MTMTGKFGVVVLNYKNYSETIDCLNTLIRQKDINMAIVVVDNLSPNDSCLRIKKFIDCYSNYDITLIQNESNIGFAKGNNVGIQFLRTEKLCDFVFILNNDTLIKDEYAIRTIMDSYYENVAVINPACYGFDGCFQQPYCLSNGKKVKEFVYLILLVLWQSFKSIFNMELSIHKMLPVTFQPEKYKYIIQGNAYVLTPSFFEYYSLLFPKTFLYLEEIALLWYIQKAELNTIYLDDTVVFHKEAGSMEMVSKANKRKKAKYMRDSLKSVIPLRFMNIECINKKFGEV